MKRNYLVAILLTALLGSTALSAQTTLETTSLKQCAAQVENGDTLLIAFLRDVYVYPPMRFANKKQEKFYWRTVRDVKKTLPYAKVLAKEIEKTDTLMQKMNKKQRRRFWREYEKTLFAQYESPFRDMTASQGQMLMKLIDRECSRTSYEVIELYKGTFVANFWQGIARLVGNDLKSGYDAKEQDKITERIIHLVESGAL